MTFCRFDEDLSLAETEPRPPASVGAEMVSETRRYLRGQDPETCEARRSTGGAADEVQVRHQSEDSKTDRSHDSTGCAGKRRGDQMSVEKSSDGARIELFSPSNQSYEI